MNNLLFFQKGIPVLVALLLCCTNCLLAQDNYRAVLTGRTQDNPILTSATGEISVEINDNQLIVSGTFRQLSSNVLSEGINIHASLAGQTGDVVFGLIPNLNTDQRSGRLDAALNTFTITPAQAAAFSTRQFYVNIATAEYPEGEIRGQILPDGLTLFYTNAYGSNHTHHVISTGEASVFVEIVSSDEMVVTGSFDNLNSPITTAHLQLGVPGEDGAATVTLTPTTNDQLSGTFEVENNTFEIDLDLIIALGERRVYLNVVSEEHTAGELRGQLVPAEAGTVFRTRLSGTNVVPSVLTQATGDLLAEVYGDSLMILSGTYRNLSSALRDDPVSRTGIFEGLAGQMGNSTLQLNPTANSATAGAIEATRNIYLLADEESDLLFNRALHISLASEAHPEGEVRGQLVPEAHAFFTGALSGLFQVPPSRSEAIGNTMVELRGTDMILSGSFQKLGDNLAANNGISSGLAGSNGPAQF
ncbi:MAG: CHRD domain-containing protein, partial [Bacteroidota bacterium]